VRGVHGAARRSASKCLPGAGGSGAAPRKSRRSRASSPRGCSTRCSGPLWSTTVSTCPSWAALRW
jgi:hypothetical protein